MSMSRLKVQLAAVKDLIRDLRARLMRGHISRQQRKMLATCLRDTREERARLEDRLAARRRANRRARSA
jgi:hypothetical protein